MVGKERESWKGGEGGRRGREKGAEGRDGEMREGRAREEETTREYRYGPAILWMRFSTPGIIVPSSLQLRWLIGL